MIAIKISVDSFSILVFEEVYYALNFFPLTDVLNVAGKKAPSIYFRIQELCGLNHSSFLCAMQDRT